MEDIAVCLRARGQFVYEVAASDHVDDVQEIRRRARTIAKKRGWRIKSLVAPPGRAPSEAASLVVYIIDGGTSPLHQQLLDTRRKKDMREVVRHVSLPPPDREASGLTSSMLATRHEAIGRREPERAVRCFGTPRVRTKLFASRSRRSFDL